MKKNKFQKGKTLAIGVFGLAAVAVMGVGFSSWVISFRDSAKIENISLKVADTQDASIRLSEAKLVREKGTGDSGTVIETFGEGEAAKDYIADASGFSFDSTEAASGNVQSSGTLVNRPKLFAYFKVELGKDVEANATIKAHMVASAASNAQEDVDAKDAYDDAIGDNKYLVKSGLEVAETDAVTLLTTVAASGNNLPTLTKATFTSNSGTTLDLKDITGQNSSIRTYSVLLGFGFEWGAAFGGVNPTEYFNRSTASNSGDEEGDRLAKTYTAISTALTNLSSIGDGRVHFDLFLNPSARTGS